MKTQLETEKILHRSGYMPFLGHLRELKTRLIVSIVAVGAGSILAFLFYDEIVAILLRPLQSIETSDSGNRLFFNTLAEGFLTKIKISVLAGVVISSPVHLFNILRFVFPGLKSNEKKMVGIGIVVSFGLSIFGFYYSYVDILPLTVKFLTAGRFIPPQVGMLLNYQRSIFYILQFILVSLFLLQTPVILELLMILNIVGRNALLRASRYVIVAIFVISALLTPPDLISQITLALPLIALFYLTILVARVFHFGEK